jgi:hypothetical protein
MSMNKFPIFYRDPTLEYYWKLESPNGGRGFRMYKADYIRYEFFDFKERTVEFLTDPDNTRVQEIVREEFVAGIRKYLEWVQKSLKALE